MKNTLYTDNFDGETLRSSVPYGFFDGYMTAALWSSTYGENGENHMDDGKHHLAAEARIEMLKDCADFISFCENQQINPFPEYNKGEYSNEELSGHDFWLTRNGHGCGYWDRGLGNMGKTLTGAAKTFGCCDLYLGDDGFIYC